MNEIDVCIVGMGASGSVLAAELSKAGMKVVSLDAGPLREPKRDFASDELEAEKLFWNDPRISTGNNPINLSRSNSGKGVGGSAVHYTAQLLRFHHSDFRTYSEEGVGEDWPIQYEDIAPYYDRMQKMLQLSGPNQFPWEPYGGHFPLPQHHDLSNNTLKFRDGCESLGLQHSVSPLAILSAPHNDREPCINRGFCEEGCMPDSKTTPLNTFVPEAVRHGTTIISDAMVTQLLMNKDGTMKGVCYVKDGQEFQIDAKIVILASYVIETPRLLLHSANRLFPDGIANSSGQVGKCLMTNTNDHMIVKYNEEIRMYRGNPVQALTLDPYDIGKRKGFARGFMMNSYGLRPVRLAGLLFDNDPTRYGEKLRDIMLDYNHYGSFAMLGEVLPQEQNRVTLSDEKDQNGMPIPKVHFSFHPNDVKIRNAAKDMLSNIGISSGGEPLYHLKTTAHLMGGCKMGNDPSTSVVNSYGQVHDVKNLFIVGTPTYVTAPSANPTLTTYSLALRTSEYILSQTREQAI
jgi:choline dehydrogenase-like flavoprotein